MNNEILRRAVLFFGLPNQINVAKEEFAELIVALSHFQRNRAQAENVISEIVDAEIMLEQLKLFFVGEHAVDFYETERARKLERLERRIEGVEK